MVIIVSLGLSQFCAPRCAVTYGGRRRCHRLISSLSAESEPSAASRLLRKFVASSSKTTSLQALSLLISHSSPFSLRLYQIISQTSWFRWNPMLAASLISLLEENDCAVDAQTLLSQAVSGLKSSRDLALFYCYLIDAYSQRQLKHAALQSYASLKEMPFSGRRPYEFMIRGLCLMGMPADAEELLQEMTFSGFKPSPFELRCLVQAYGRAGAFSEMLRVLESLQESGIALDVVSTNIVLSCYGDYGRFSEMISWVRKIYQSGISFSFRTFNTVLNSCPTVVTMTKNVHSLPLSIEDFFRKVQKDCLCPDEVLLLRQLVKLPLLADMLEWSESEGKLDLHGLHLSSAYVIILQWMEELRVRFSMENVVPLEVSIICGSGKHSESVGKSHVKKLVSEMMTRLRSPLKIDRKNIGRFIANGKRIRDWLC